MKAKPSGNLESFEGKSRGLTKLLNRYGSAFDRWAGKCEIQAKGWGAMSGGGRGRKQGWSGWGELMDMRACKGERGKANKGVVRFCRLNWVG